MKMAPGLPAEESNKNGMFKLARHFVEQYAEPVVCVVLIDSSEMNVNHDKHTKDPKLRILQIEPMTNSLDIDAAMEILSRAYRARTSEQLELDLFPKAPLATAPTPYRSPLTQVPSDGRVQTGIASALENLR